MTNWDDKLDKNINLKEVLKIFPWNQKSYKSKLNLLKNQRANLERENHF